MERVHRFKDFKHVVPIKTKLQYEALCTKMRPLDFPTAVVASSDRQTSITISALLQLTFRALICCFVLFFQLTELLQWYAATFRDPMMLQPPEWFKAFIYCEAFLQMPFFPIAVYAFLKGRYKTSVRTCPAQHFCVTLAFCTAGKVYLSVLSNDRDVLCGALCYFHGKFYPRKQHRIWPVRHKNPGYRPLSAAAV